MWLSTTLVLTYGLGLLFVHVSEVSCLGLRWGQSLPRGSYPMTPAFDRVPTSNDMMNQRSGAWMESVDRYNDDIEKAVAQFLQPNQKTTFQRQPPPAANGVRRTISSTELQEMYGAQVLEGRGRPNVVISKQIDKQPSARSQPSQRNTFGSSSGSTTETNWNPPPSQSPYSTRSEPTYRRQVSSYYTPPVFPYTPDSPRASPYTSTQSVPAYRHQFSSYDSRVASPYTPATSTQSTPAYGRQGSSYNTRVASPYTPYTPATSPYTPATSPNTPATSTQSVPAYIERQRSAYYTPAAVTPYRQSDSSNTQSTVQPVPPRTNSGLGTSFSTGGSWTNVEDQLRSAVTPYRQSDSSNTQSTVQPVPPRTNSGLGTAISTGGSWTNVDNQLRSACLPNVPPNPLRYPVNNKYEFSPIDGRRLDGRQNLTWPAFGGPEQLTDAEWIGPEFKGLLIPASFIEQIKTELEKKMRQNNQSNEAIGEKRFFKIKLPDWAYDVFDVDLLHKAIREAQGNDDDWDKPDPWTQNTIYSHEVLEENLRLHNDFRKKHYAPNLEYLTALDEMSRKYAIKLAPEVSKYGDAALDHDYTAMDKYGLSQNLYKEDTSFDGRPPAKVVKHAVEAWYREINYFNQFGVPAPNITHPKITGHFTALVWRASRRMGLGIAKFRNKTTERTHYVVVCYYDPAGNVRRLYHQNVIRENEYRDKPAKLPSAYNPHPSKMGNFNDDNGYYQPLEEE